MAEKKKVAVHPDQYMIFKPNKLIEARKQPMSLMEHRVYSEVLNYNHKNEPDRLIYKISYDLIFDAKDSQNRMHNYNRISSNLQTRVFYFDEEYVQQFFGRNVKTSISPFSAIFYNEDFFEVHLGTHFKKILTSVPGADGNFTKGHIETLRMFNHEISFTFYWVIRQKQKWAGTWTVDLMDLKEMLGLEGKYEVWSNFKAKVLDVVREEFSNTWVEFAYEPIRKGKGAPVTEILFKFQNGPKQEKDAPAGEVYPWEQKLLRYGMEPDKVRFIRHRVRAGSTSIHKEKQIEWNWDAEYVRFSLEAIQDQLADKKKDKNKKQIENVGGWIYKGLIDGHWLDHVLMRKEKIREEVQLNLSLQPASDTNVDQDTGEKRDITPLERKVNKIMSDRTIVTQEEIEGEPDGYRYLYTLSKIDQSMTFDEYMIKYAHCVKEGDKWVRV